MSASRIHPFPFRPLWAAHRWVSQPCPAASEPEQRRARFLSILLASLGGLVALALVAALLFETPHDPRRGLYAALAGALLLLFVLAGALNHRGRYVAAVHLVMTCAVLGPWVAILFDANIRRGDLVPPLYLGLPVLLATILLSERATLLLAAAQLTGFLALLANSPAAAAQNWPSMVVFMLMLTVLSVVTSLVARSDMRQIVRQNELLAERETQLRELSLRDPLTGLFNRRYLEETLERELRRAGRKGQGLGLILVDIDHFKRINDRFGHAAGDAALCAVAALFQSAVRGSDIVCRYGGEEFVFMLPEASLPATLRRAEEIRAGAAQLRPEWQGLRLDGLTLSLGVAAYPEHAQDGAALLAAADAAMYRSKRAGRNCVTAAGVYRPVVPADPGVYR